MTANEKLKTITDLARHLEFDIVRVAPVYLAPKYTETFEDWIDKDCHGQMQYLKRRIDENITIETLLPGAKNVITFGINYFQKSLRVPKSKEGRISRYAVTRDYHKIITKKMKRICKLISDSMAAQARAYVDTGPVLEKAYSETSGVGYIGKNSCLITEEFGSWVFLGEILTTVELPHTVKKMKINCGSCTRCLDHCPTNAINDNCTIDARRCISYLTIENRGAIETEFRDNMGNWVFGCDICQDVCPHNTRAVQARAEDFKNIRFSNQSLPLETILSIKTDEAFLAMFAGTPMMRAKRRGLVRNACIAAGNSGDRQLVPLLEEIVSSEDDLIKEHAIWAIKKIKSIQKNEK